jgi:phage shock protein C
MGKRLYKSESNKMISGVCGGIAAYFDVDPSLIRVATVILGLLTTGFPMLVGYIICACILPSESQVR